MKYVLLIFDEATNKIVLEEEGTCKSGRFDDFPWDKKGWKVYGPLDKVEPQEKATHYGQLRIHPSGKKSGSNTFFDAVRINTAQPAGKA